MSAWYSVKINDQHIGMVEIQRQEPLDLSDPAAIADEVCTYTVRRDRQVVGEVKHRYGDKVWKLNALAAALIANVDASKPPPCPACGDEVDEVTYSAGRFEEIGAATEAVGVAVPCRCRLSADEWTALRAALARAIDARKALAS
jgi:hypothetical protein